MIVIVQLQTNKCDYIWCLRGGSLLTTQDFGNMLMTIISIAITINTHRREEVSMSWLSYLVNLVNLDHVAIPSWLSSQSMKFMNMDLQY